MLTSRSKRRGRSKMAVAQPKINANTQAAGGWRKMQAIASKQMSKKGITVEDIQQMLKDMRAER